jgi:microcystin-dependent protein
MGKSNANISRNMYDEKKRYQLLVHQQGVPWVEADENDRNWIFYNLLRRFIQRVIGNGSPDNGFKIVTGAANDFMITGGDGTVDGAGRLLVEGFQCSMPESRSYRGADNLECTPVSTDLAETVLTDSAANFTLGGSDDNLASRILVPDITQPDKTYSIVANTQTTITISGDMLSDAIQVGAHYQIELSIPAVDRTDEVYIDCYLDEISSDEDPELKHTLGLQIETQRRLKLIQNVFVAEGSTTPSPYTDSDGNQHYTLKLATIQRYAGQDVINAEDISDNRPILDGGFWNLWQEVLAVKNELIAARGSTPSLDARLDGSLKEDGSLKAGHNDLADMPDTEGLNADHDTRYLKKAGDTMTGDLGMASGKTVDGRDISEDGAKLDTIEEYAGRMAEGTILMYAGSLAPPGWLLCNGAEVSRTTYANLFAVIGTTFGAGDGSTTFILPDLRGRSPIGMGQGTGLSNRVLGADGGAEKHKLTISEMPAHSHSYKRPYVTENEGQEEFDAWNKAMGTYSTGNTGGNQSHNNMHPFLVVNYIIKS